MPLDLRDHIREIPDYPQRGIQFKDITPLIGHPLAFRTSIDRMAAAVSAEKIDLVASPEARGFIFGPVLAAHLGAGFVPIRKQDKLPHHRTSVTYDLEYGTDTVEMHSDAIQPGQRVLLVDDVLATGGTISACAELVEKLQGKVVACVFLIELTFLDGRSRVSQYPIHSILEE
jgi:adenine phosphoribosyltransferase